VLEFILRDMTPDGLATYVTRQLGAVFPDGRTSSADSLRPHVQTAIERIRLCFTGIDKMKFRDGGRVLFNYMHPDHYATFLYLLANTVSRRDREDPVAFRLFYLNKALHGLDAYHDAELPEVFQFMHPVGTILGQAKYGNYFCVYQGVSVGSSEDGIFPEIGDHVVLYAGSSVIGGSKIGSNVVVGAGAMVMNRDIPDDKIVLANSHLELHNNPRHVADRRFR
jgi:serine O-acetyltransferase